MTDAECITFLQWALPHLRLRWAGFRKVRRQVCKRIRRRIGELGLAGTTAYRDHLEHNPLEWPVLDGLCSITISRFYRDKAVFDFLGHCVLSELARTAATDGESVLHAWSIGCASGEEPYSLSLVWHFVVAPQAPGIDFRILATDVDTEVLRRASHACYEASTLRLLPQGWMAQAFEPSADGYCLRREYRKPVTLRRADIRTSFPETSFHLILCRNLVFTYFEDVLQRETLSRILSRLRPGGALVIGKKETLPAGFPALCAWAPNLGIYRRIACLAMPDHDGRA
jgi:chemotaxis protein methyltransferase CheR